MSNKIIGIALSALCGVALAASFSSASSAATSVPYQKYISKYPTCTGLVCTIEFPVVPASKRLEISNATCYIRTGSTPGSGTGIYAAQLIVKTAAGSTVTAVTLKPILVGSNGDAFTDWASNDEVFVFATAAQHIQAYVQLSLGVFQQVACSIGGQLVTP